MPCDITKHEHRCRGCSHNEHEGRCGAPTVFTKEPCACPGFVPAREVVAA
ncbi:MAG: hypothetical protein KGK07_06440 [Chloroflexota bacterium]|nr:hypothetical protein [Chloroflexota bacterium]